MIRKIVMSVTLAGVISISACNKCYDCTKKCGTCIKTGYPTLAGCQGDTALQGYSVEAWKSYYESYGYTCTYNNTIESVCGQDNKNELSNKFYECISK